MSDVEKVIADNTGLVYQQLHKFNLAYNDDAISYAMEALWQAAETYDPSKGFAFSTYASSCVYNGIMMYFRGQNKESNLDTVSIDTELNDEGFTLVDILVGAPDIDTEKLQEIYHIIYKVIDKLHIGTHRDIVMAWVDSNFEATQNELADTFHVKQGTVSRVLSSFKYKLKKELEVLL